MITYTSGNLLEAKVDALVNTVNTYGVMGKGIALMFKEAFPGNFDAYATACKNHEVQVGHMFVTHGLDLLGPKWVINFPTKKHWRHPTKIEWIVDGLGDLRRVIIENKIQSVALPPLGCGNGGLDWNDVKPEIERALGDLDGVDVLAYEPTKQYQNVAKSQGVKKLTPARALVAELVRRYWILGIECTLLEIQKLAWFLEREIDALCLDNPLDLRFEANRYGPYAFRLTHLLNALDGSYLHCEKRLADAGPLDTIWFDDGQTQYVDTYLKTHEATVYSEALDRTTRLIDGFESPLGLEALATIDWLLVHSEPEPTVQGIRRALQAWPVNSSAVQRKQKVFSDRLIELCLERLLEHRVIGSSPIT